MFYLNASQPFMHCLGLSKKIERDCYEKTTYDVYVFTAAQLGKLTQCQICIGYPLTSQRDPKGPGTSKLGWRYFEHYKVDRN